ncbi:MAG: hypothetical protein AAF597_11570 [Bacteroidota bacterium]
MSNRDRIDQYLSGQLSPEAMTAFQEELNTNQALAKELAEVRTLQLVVKDGIRQELRQRAQQQWEKQRTPARLSPVRWWLAAAAVILLVFSFGWWFGKDDSSRGAALFVQHFTIPPPPGTRAIAPEDSLWVAAIAAYQKAQYPTAINYFDQLSALPDYARRHETQLLLGISNLAIKRFDPAALAFQQIPANSPFHQDAEWYLALTYLSSEQLVLAKAIFQQIAQDERHFKRDDAMKILIGL